MKSLESTWKRLITMSMAFNQAEQKKKIQVTNHKSWDKRLFNVDADACCTTFSSYD